MKILYLIEHMLAFNFTIYYLDGKKMHDADLHSRLAGKNMDSMSEVIHITFNVISTIKNRKPPQLPKLFTARPSKQFGYLLSITYP